MQALCTVPPAELPNTVSCFLACFRRRAHVDHQARRSCIKTGTTLRPLAVISEAEAPVMPFRQRLLNEQDIHVML